MLVLAVAGRLGHASAPAFLAAVAAAVATPNRPLVIDFADVDYLSSAGISAIKDGMALARAAGVNLVAAAVTEPVRMTMELGGLLPDLALEPTRALAVERAERSDAR